MMNSDILFSYTTYEHMTSLTPSLWCSNNLLIKCIPTELVRKLSTTHERNFNSSPQLLPISNAFLWLSAHYLPVYEIVSWCPMTVTFRHRA